MGPMALRRFFRPSAMFAAAFLVASASIGARIAAPPASPAPAVAGQAPQAAPPQDLAATAAKFEQTCAGCHGAGGISGDRAPALANSAKLRALSDAEIGAIIRNGTPGGMPPFAFDTDELGRFVALIRSKNQVAKSDATPEQIAAGEKLFFAAGGGEGDCASCHMIRGRGGSNGPDLSMVADRSTVADMGKMLDDPTAMMGARTTASCPGWAFCPDFQWTIVNVKMRDESALRGFARNEAEHSLQLQTLDGKMRALNDTQYASYAREPKSFMPAFKGSADQRRALLAYLGSLKGQRLGPVTDSTMPAPSAAEVAAVLQPARGEWPSYNGTPTSNRHSPIDQINTGNVGQLKLAWSFAPGGAGLETTPVVMDGVMYVTGAKLICALDASTGRSFWCAARNARQQLPSGGIAEQQQQRPGGGEPSAAVGPANAARPSAGVASGNGPNRGVAVVGNRVIFTSDDGYLIAVNRLTGGVMWTVPLTNPKFGGRYYATPAPLVIGDLVISGVSGGDSPTRGFLAAFKVTTGELAWRFWTVPAPGDPAAKTWQGPDMATGGAATWMTGSYDKESDTVYWGVGNPYPSTDGAGRLGDNLYANSMIALDAKTGKLRWHYQFTPHDVHDWDATAPLLLVDETYQGKPRKLVMQANRNGFFYVLDRTNGQFLFAKQFVDKMNWASGIDAKGRSILIPGREPTPEGVFACPAVRGATNWFSTAYNPETKLFYLMAAEDCGVFRSKGRIYGANVDVKSPGQRFLRAIDPQTGKIVWEKPLTGSHEANYSGVLSTAGGLVFHGETAGGFAAVDGKTGKTLWYLPTNDAWRASPMTYMVDGHQYVAVAAGSNIISVTLPEGAPQ
jgi:PQQ-dependent dehydrogenase (methanol/ethanol family)